MAKSKILILEDERPLAKALELKLIHEGFEVKSMQSGKGILEIIKKDAFSLIVCDLMMPEVDGFQVLQILKDNKITTPVFVLTNLSQSEDEKRVRSLGATEFIIKSNTPIVEVIKRIKQKVK